MQLIAFRKSTQARLNKPEATVASLAVSCCVRPMPTCDLCRRIGSAWSKKLFENGLIEEFFASFNALASSFVVVGSAM